MYLPLFVVVVVIFFLGGGGLCWSLFWCALLGVIFSFCNHLDERERERERERARASCLLCFGCLSYVMLLLMLCGYSSRCCGLVCSV